MSVHMCLSVHEYMFTCIQAYVSVCVASLSRVTLVNNSPVISSSSSCVCFPPSMRVLCLLSESSPALTTLSTMQHTLQA